MKKLLTLSLILLCSKFAVAQYYDRDYKAFKIDFSAGYSMIAKDSGAKAGAVFAIEPKFSPTDAYAIGVRIEAAMMAHGVGIDGLNGSAVTQANTSVLLTGDYYFNGLNSMIRPFIGTGFGIFSEATVTLKDSYGYMKDVPASNKFAFMLRGGFEVGHFRTGVEYNMTNSINNINSNYLSIKIGWAIGGGFFDKITGKTY